MAPDGVPTVVVCKWQADLVEALLDLGAEVLLVLDRYDLMHERPSGEIHRRCRMVYQVSTFDSIEELAAVAVDIRWRGYAVDQVIGHSELSQLGGGYLGLLLGTVTDPLVAVSHRDKRVMKDRVRRTGVPTARFRSLSDPGDRAAVVAAGRSLSMPAIVKPAAGYGAMSTVRVDDVDELLEVTADFRYQPMLRSRQLIVEEFVDGDEVCVDATWRDGEPVTFVVHRYFHPRLAVAGSADPGSLDGSRVLPAEEHPDLLRRVRAVHDRINGVLGIRDGATHMETFVRPDGEVVFSEIATRIGGGWIPDMLTAYLGHSIWRLLAQAAVTGAVPPPRPRCRYVAGLHLRPETPGVITALPSDAEFAAFPGVLGWRCARRIGDRVRLSHPSEWCLQVVFGADTVEDLDRLRVRVARRFTVETAGAADG